MEHREDHNEIPEFTLEDILAEFGSGSDLYRTEDLPAEENSPETAPAEAPAQQEASAEPEPHAEPETSAAAELPGKPEGLRFTPGADPVDMDFPAEVLEEVFSSGGPLLPEEDQPPETQIIHFPHQPVSEEEGKPAAETTATEASSEENAPEEEPAEEPQETPEPQEAPKVSLEQIMNDTVSSVLEEQEDGILEERPPLREVLRHWWEKLTRPRSAAPIPQDTETLWEQPQEPQPEPEPDPEPDMDVAVRAEKRRCARLKRQCWCVLPEAVLLTVLSVLDGLGLYIPRLWAALPVLRGIIPGGSLLLALALSGRVWRSARKQLSQRRFTCEAAALLASLVCLGDCVYAALGYGEQLPLAAVPVISLLLCLWGALVLSRQVTRPVREMTAAMKRVQLGELSARVVPRGEGELGQLAVGFNQMVAECELNLRRSVERQKELNDTRIRMMQSQLNPHFLYNTLDSMKWMGVTHGVPQVATLAEDLAKILRASISGDEFVTLGQELELLERYIDIQLIRFEDRFACEIEVDDALMGCMVPKLVLQPIVENAVIHGVRDMDDGYINLGGGGRGRSAPLRAG